MEEDKEAVVTKAVKKKLIVLDKINRGHGAGGAGTNANGLPYETVTDLRSHWKEEVNSVGPYTYVTFIEDLNNVIYIYSSKSKFPKMMQANGHLDATVSMGHGGKWPDECYLDLKNSTVFIIEKKFQLKSGSVCEKIQTAPFKLHNYKRLFPKLKVVYMYCLSDWFKTNCVAELEYLALHDIPVFWGRDFDYKEKVIRFITQTSLNHAKT